MLHTALYWVVDALPDVANLILALLGIVLSLPKLAEKIEDNKKIRFGLALTCVLLGIAAFVVGSIQRRQATAQMQDLTNKMNMVADFFKNTTPPPGVRLGASTSLQTPLDHARPNPPEGLIVVIDDDWGGAAINLASQITQFVHSQGEPPSRRPGESDMDYVVRSNQWYSGTLTQYKKQFAPQVITMVGVLSEKSLVQKQLVELARDPVNVMGIRAVATELDGVGRQLRQMQRRK